MTPTRILIAAGILAWLIFGWSLAAAANNDDDSSSEPETHQVLWQLPDLFDTTWTDDQLEALANTPKHRTMYPQTRVTELACNAVGQYDTYKGPSSASDYLGTTLDWPADAEWPEDQPIYERHEWKRGKPCQPPTTSSSPTSTTIVTSTSIPPTTVGPSTSDVASTSTFTPTTNSTPSSTQPPHTSGSTSPTPTTAPTGTPTSSQPLVVTGTAPTPPPQQLPETGSGIHIGIATALVLTGTAIHFATRRRTP